MAQRLPDKIYFKIGEVSEIVGVEPYVLRYWETEFDLLKPSKAPSRHRLYKKKNDEPLPHNKPPPYSQGFPIESTKKKTSSSCSISSGFSTPRASRSKAREKN